MFFLWQSNYLRLSCLRTLCRMSRSIFKIGEFGATSPKTLVVLSKRSMRLLFVSIVSSGKNCRKRDFHTAARTIMLPNCLLQVPLASLPI